MMVPVDIWNNGHGCAKAFDCEATTSAARERMRSRKAAHSPWPSRLLVAGRFDCCRDLRAVSIAPPGAWVDRSQHGDADRAAVLSGLFLLLEAGRRDVGCDLHLAAEDVA